MGRDTQGSNHPAFVKGPFAAEDYFQLTVSGHDAAEVGEVAAASGGPVVRAG